MKVLFLDIDGVLNSADWFKKLGAEHGKSETFDIIEELDPKAVARVRRVLEATGCKIVLSSTWRMHERCRDAIYRAGLPIHDVTPRLEVGMDRAAEIRAWLAVHPEVTRYAVIDDDTDARIEGHFVKCHWKHGMYGKHEKGLIALLGGPTTQT